MTRRFLPRPAERVVPFYNKRGTCEQWIKEGKGAINWTRLVVPNVRRQRVRLQLHALAMLIPMSLARPDRAWFYATVCTTTSVAGGILGYLIGALLYDSVGLWLIKFYGLAGKVDAFREAYAQWGSWIILIKGVTPIPYKLVTIASGFAGYSFLMFVLLSFVARGMRFYGVAFLLNRYGPQARAILEERLGLWVSIAAVLLLGGIAAAVYLF
jgi:membrane protein YqaA with SNARE-associated domain